jgi:hypothetical protein
MKTGVAYAALCALTLAAPATAERIYVPVLGTNAAGDEVLATKVRVTNAQGASDFTPAGRVGLIALEADSAAAVSAWTVDRAGKRVLDVPVFSEDEAYNAGVEVALGDLPRPRAMASLAVGAANLSDQTATCKASFYDSDGILTSEISFDVEPRSLARKDGLAANGRIKAVQVSCDQSFYPFAVAADQGGKSPILAKGIGPNGACSVWLTLTKQSNGHYTAATIPGFFHEASKAAPKGVVCIKAPSELKIASARFEWDVFSGPWSSRDKSGLHNLAYFFLDRYRSGVIGNINQAGPNKNTLKFMQNVGMAVGTNTNVKVGYTMQTGQVYHYVYTFNAANKRATLEGTLNNLPIANVGLDTRPGHDQTLIVRPFGNGGLAGLAMTAEFGNYLGQHHPEEASVGWKFGGLKIDMTPKP